MSSSEVTDSDEQPTSKCNYCGLKKTLLEGKKYCKNCSLTMFKECKSCHLPIRDESSFTLSTSKCNTCVKKSLIQEKKRKTTTATTTTKTKQPLPKKQCKKIIGYIPLYAE